jgi:hypothetical protein
VVAWRFGCGQLFSCPFSFLYHLFRNRTDLYNFKGILSFVFCIKFYLHFFYYYLFCFESFFQFHLLAFDFIYFYIKFSPYFFIAISSHFFLDWYFFLILSISIWIHFIFTSYLFIIILIAICFVFFYPFYRFFLISPLDILLIEDLAPWFFWVYFLWG